MSLAKLTADSIRDNGRPLRLAIDFAIWQFQAQAARGGTNPAIRTLFYRLVRLLGTPIQPIFVFDGPNKPVFKRNKRSGRGDGVAVAQAKRLIRLFGFPVHDAPGEAEAECALMQKRGMVDAVLSEDVDTIMFGCSRTLRNWSSEGKSSKTPTHVSLYDVSAMRLAELGLDREGMVLVALMSGGDYLPDGIPGCGVKVACEAAKAGYGRKICRLKTSDKEGLQRWRDSLIHELHTNESKYFRTKHKALSIPEDFPNLEVLRYYTHPVVSPESTMEAVKQKLDQDQELHLDALREFARETFNWDFRIGAIKFIRVLGAALLVRKMWRAEADDGTIQRISGRRTHFSTDGESELRLSFTPQDLVPIDLSQEVEEDLAVSREGLALNSDDDMDDPASLGSSQPVKIFDVTKADLAWVLEDFVKKTAPLAFSEWEEAGRAKALRKSPKKTRGPKSKATSTTGMPRGAIDKFVRVTKTSSLDRVAPREMDPATKPGKSAHSAIPPTTSMRPPPTMPVPSPTPREQSKPPAPSRPRELDQHPDDPRRSSSSQATPPRTSKPPASRETILISSSPPREASPTPPSPTPQRRAPPARSQELPGGVRSRPSPVQTPGGLNSTRKRMSRATAAHGTSQSPSLSRYKQTSLDMYTTRGDPFSSSQVPSPGKSAPAIPVDDAGSGNDDDDLPPLSEETPPTPPKRRASRSRIQSSPESTWGRSPTKATGKKKLLVPRASAVGYFKEVEVDADIRDEVSLREERRLAREGHGHVATRYSDVSIIDLTRGQEG